MIDHPLPALHDKSFTSFDEREFGYQQWSGESEKNLIIIGVHGISGVSQDYKTLALEIQESRAAKALYAYEMRGQGRDPIESERGDIRDVRHWFRDLYTFTDLVRAKHPKAKIIWMGESLGSLIVTHAYGAYDGDEPPCDGIILASPITSLPRNFGYWKTVAIRAFATAFPQVRISLESLSVKDGASVVKGVDHKEQVQKNDYYVPSQTLRFFFNVSEMINQMHAIASQIQVPALVMNAGNDIFNDPEDIKAFCAAIPSASEKTHIYYPESYHLLFYGHESEQVLKDTLKWLEIYS